MSNSRSVSSAPVIAGISYVFPESTQSVQQLEDESQLQSTPETLESFGFANVHVGIGKASFDAEKIAANAKALLHAIVQAKPSASKGTYLQSVTMATTMGPGLKLDPTQKFE